jgi:hypothetical protein
MRADCVPAGESGRWTVRKDEITPKQALAMKRLQETKFKDVKYVPPGPYTWLHCVTLETHLSLPGDTVMNDFPDELKKHLEFIMVARGRVLVGGLGLGCVVRGLLAKGRVEAIDVIERSADVIKLCGDSVKDARVTIHQRDALNGFIKGGPWDWAWWDLWSDPERDEPHLQVTHMELVKRFSDRVRNLQGAWAMPRQHRRPLREIGVML